MTSPVSGGVHPSIVHVLPSASVGGIQRLLIDLCTVLRRSGTSVTVAFGRRTGEFVNLFERAEIPTIDLGLGSRGSFLSRERDAIQRLNEVGDIVHFHDFSPSFMRIAAGTARPVVYTEHIPLHITGTLRRLAERRFLNRYCDRVVAVSRFTAGQIVDILRIAPERISVVHNGLTQAERPPTLRGDRVVTTFGFLGRLDRWKRPQALLEAVALMRRRDAVRVLIAGEGEMRAELEAHVRSSGLARTVELLGHVADPTAFCDRLDVLVHPARGEPFGLVLLEAAARGVLPVVLADGGGALEVLPGDGVVAGDVADLASRLDALIDSPLLVEAARAERARWVRAAFSVERTADRYLDVYRSIPLPRRPRPHEGTIPVQS